MRLARSMLKCSGNSKSKLKNAGRNNDEDICNIGEGECYTLHKMVLSKPMLVR